MAKANDKNKLITQKKVSEFHESHLQPPLTENEDAIKAEEKNYLDIALEACEAYAEELGDKFFDEKPTD